jgi:hypothetical protein
LEEISTAVSASTFDMVWLNYYLSLSETAAPTELDALAEGADSGISWALVFEIKNRNEKNLPTMQEAKFFITMINKLRQRMMHKNKKIKFVCPVYLSANGFEPGVEAWLHEHGVLTADLDSWLC